MHGNGPEQQACFVVVLDIGNMHMNANQGRYRHHSNSSSSRSSNTWRLLLLLAGASVALNISLHCIFWNGGRGTDSSSPSRTPIKTFLRALSSDGQNAAPEGDRKSSPEVDAVAALQHWSDVVSTFVESHRDIGWGQRTGGVILAGEPETICGVGFEGNSVRMNDRYPQATFHVNEDMVAGGDRACREQLQRVAVAGWHQGQIFFYRLLVDRPGHYTVRMTVVLYHDDERRGDGVVLGLEDLLKVRLQCAASKGRYVVEPSLVFVETMHLMAVVEYDTVALGGEILLVLEGIYTCVGLSVVEVFYHENPEGDAPPGASSADGAGTGDEHDGADGEARNLPKEVPVQQLDQTTNDAARLAPLREAWKTASGVCATAFTEEAVTQESLQQKAISPEAAEMQRYFNEWARRERLDQSTGRYCRPRQAPRLGEPGWTWAEKSTRAERQAAAQRIEVERRHRAQAEAAETYELTVRAAMGAGLKLGSAQVLAAEAIERAVLEAHGKGVSEKAKAVAQERVIMAAEYMQKMGMELKARPNVEYDPEVILDKGRRRRRLAERNERDQVTLIRYDRAGGVVAAGSIGETTRIRSPTSAAEVAGGVKPAGPSEPVPPPMCPARLVDLMEEALYVVAESNLSKAGEKWQHPERRSLSDGAAAAAERSRSRTRGAAGRFQGIVPVAAQRWAQTKLPEWLRSRMGAGTANRRRDKLMARRRDLANRALGAGFEAVVAVRAHDVEWPPREIVDSGKDAGARWGGGSDGDVQTGGSKGAGRAGEFPVQFTGFTWDGLTVVMKEIVPGCARVAHPATPASVDAVKSDSVLSSDSMWASFYGDRGAGGIEQEAGGKLAQYELVPKKAGDVGNHAAGGGDRAEEKAKGEERKRPCMAVEAMVVPSADIVVDIIVPVSSGLVTRLETLMPQMERLAKGSDCTPLPDTDPLAPKCTDPENYSPAFWPERLSRKGQHTASFGSAGDGDRQVWSRSENGRRNWSVEGGAASWSEQGGMREQRNGTNFRVIVATDSAEVEEMLEQYDVDTVYVATRTPFTKAKAIQDAAVVIPDDHIMFVHDADLFPPCGLADALRQTVVQGVQAVNFLLSYDNQGVRGQCLYPLSTFGPMAMYKSDFTAVGGIDDSNSGRWGFEDTYFLHKVMLGDSALGVLRVHLPGLVHKWHEITPWKCLVWAWGGPASGTSGGTAHHLQMKDPPDPPAAVLGA